MRRPAVDVCVCCVCVCVCVYVCVCVLEGGFEHVPLAAMSVVGLTKCLGMPIAKPSAATRLVVRRNSTAVKAKPVSTLPPAPARLSALRRSRYAARIPARDHTHTDTHTTPLVTLGSPCCLAAAHVRPRALCCARTLSYIAFMAGIDL